MSLMDMITGKDSESVLAFEEVKTSTQKRLKKPVHHTRARVEGGWIYNSFQDGELKTTVFCPDAAHPPQPNQPAAVRHDADVASPPEQNESNIPFDESRVIR
ncbi:hypothetical protein [uncultured Umboniibacter sp.]|uniref:hypothetical protein n=1 Tax=uncultured Umboniibacter sp. TaxID=1798917 RepID=UPI0026354640|nr:hypothetical protein [uncultured Umboniibacter sp.]